MQREAYYFGGHEHPVAGRCTARERARDQLLQSRMTSPRLSPGSGGGTCQGYFYTSLQLPPYGGLLVYQSYSLSSFKPSTRASLYIFSSKRLRSSLSSLRIIGFDTSILLLRNLPLDEFDLGLGLLSLSQNLSSRPTR